MEIRAPQGALVSLAREGQFEAPQPGPRLAGMLIGAVYRLQVTRIPGLEGFEVYPTIEVIDRLYPPRGEVWRFPIPIELTLEELAMALNNRQVTRVIYLENPSDALPVAQKPGEQNWFEAAVGENPLEVADRLGRPVAILRLGARLPGPAGPDAHFLFGSPAWWPGPVRPPAPPRDAAAEEIKPGSP